MATSKKPGAFVISLDFELYWGMFDKVTIEQYGPNILGVRDALPKMLALFEQYGLHATWATVGMLAHSNKHELEQSLPFDRPQYERPKLSSYKHLENGHVGETEEDDPYHFGASLIEQILKAPNQELASHTFSHYYAQEAGQTIDTFREDIRASKKVLEKFGVTPMSLVFPRNQFNDEYLAVVREEGLSSFRGNENHYLYFARPENEQSLKIRGLRLLDHYLPLSGAHTYPFPAVAEKPYNLASSRFLRPYHPKLAFLDWLRILRVTRAMTKAAKRGEVFHLWWHPHNFGKYTKENLAVLERIARHFQKLQKKYGMQAMTMQEVSESIHG